MKRVTSPERGGKIQTAGLVAGDGTLLELFPDPSDLHKLGLLSWKNQIVQVGSRIHHAGVQYVPIRIDASVSRALRLPTRVAPKERTRELFSATRSLLAGYLHQPDPCITKLVFSVFSSWLSHFLPMAPILWVVAPTGSPKNVTLQVLSLICRRPLVLVGVKRGDFRFLPMVVQPTLLFDEPDLQPSMQKVLLGSSRRGEYFASGRELLDLYGAKIICTRSYSGDTLLESDALRVHLIPTNGEIRFPDARAQEEIAEEFQARFFSYRLRNFDKIRLPAFDVAHLTLPAQDLARSLGAAVVGDGELQGNILSLITEQDDEAMAERSNSTEAVLLEVLLFYCHKKGESQVRVSELAHSVCEIFSGRGYHLQISPESLGWILKRLEFKTENVGSAGNGVKLTVSIRRRVHQLALHYNVRAMQHGFRAGCTECVELEKKTDQPENDAV